MKKTLMALALALPLASTAFAATSNVDVYGSVNFAVENSNVSGDSASVTSGGSYVGFKGSEALGGDLSAVWQIEREFDATAGTGFVRDTFVGLTGKLGTVKAGVLSMPYRTATLSLDPFVDTLADQNSFVGGMDFLSSAYDLRADQAISYTAPVFHGLTMSTGFTFSDAPSFGANASSVDSFSMAADYTRGTIYATVAYQNMADVDGMALGRQGSNALKLGAGYGFGNTKLGLIHEEVRGALGERDSWLANVTHTLGNVELKAEYGRVSELGEQPYGWAVGADYDLSKRTSAYALFANGNDGMGDEIRGYGLGLRHSF
jgi:predicted porin